LARLKIREDGLEVGKGGHAIEVKFDYDGGGAGKGGTVTLACDDEAIGTGKVEKTVPGVCSFDDFLVVGQDGGESVVADYAERGGVFNGVIEEIAIDVSPDAHHNAELVVRAKQRKQ
jgi:hypothetical protein